MKRTAKLGYILLVSICLAGLLAAGMPSQAMAQTNATNVGTLDLKATFVSISVYSPFTGDDNANNVATVEYRESGSGSWKQVGSFIVDRRGTLVYGGGTVDNPFKYQWRGSIVGLSPNTQYEVRVTYFDPDGGSGTVEGSIWTRNDVIPLGTGNVYYVATDGSDTPGGGSEASPWRTIQYAADRVSAGDTVYIKAGTYYEQVTVPTSGTANNYITFQNYGTDTVTIDGQNIRSTNFSFSGISYVKIRGLTLRNTTYPNVYVVGSSKYIVIEDNTISDGGGGYRGNVDVLDGSEGTVIRNNTISQVKVVGEPFAIRFDDTEGGHIVYGNTMSGDYFDVMGGATQRPTSGPYRDSDIYDNIFAGGDDDVVEIDGGNMNVRFWGNQVNSVIYASYDIMSWAPVVLGPLYVFRNVFDGEGGGAAGAFKIGGGGYYTESDGPVFIYHNTVVNVPIGLLPWGNNNRFENQVYRNNIFQTTSWGISCLASNASNSDGDSFDYNNYGTATYLVRWDGIHYTGASGLADFYAATGHEEHGIAVDSQFVDPANGDVRLQSTSPVIDQGVILPGFNDASSAWPYSGSAPDMGAFEYDSGPPSPTYTLTIVVSGSGSTAPAAGTDQYAEGTVVDISATADSGWQFDSWTGDVADSGSAATTVTMDSDKAVTANFSSTGPPPPTYTLTIVVSGSGSTAPAAGTHQYVEGTVVGITATPDSGWQFDSWSGDVTDPSSAATTVAMDSDKTVTASFSQIPLPSVPLRVNAGGEIYIESLGNSWEADQAYVPAMWGFYGEDLTVDRGTGRAISGTEDDRIYQTERYGLSGYRFDLGNGTYDIILHFAETWVTGPGQRVFDVSIEGQLVLDDLDIFSEVGYSAALQKVFNGILVQDGQLNVDFAAEIERPEINGIEIFSAGPPPPTYTLTMAVTGNGSTAPAAGTHQYAEGTIVNISATPDSGWQFDNWTGDVANRNSAVTTVTMDSDKAVTANFSSTGPPPPTYTLTIVVSGSGSTAPAAGTHQYVEGTVVGISAMPDSGWQFVTWAGDVTDPSSAATTVAMDSDKTVTASFSQIPPPPPPIGGGGGGGGYIPPPPLIGGGASLLPPPTPTPTPTPTPISATTFNISLRPGWNLFSFNVIPPASDIESILAPIEGQFSAVLGFDGMALSYYPDLPPELNTLRTLDPYHGYWIKMEQGATLSITGTPMATTTPLSLNQGWNAVSYLPHSPLPVSTALASIDGLYTAVLAFDGQGLSYYPSLPPEMNTLEVLKPGQSFWIKVDAAAVLVYPGD